MNPPAYEMIAGRANVVEQADHRVRIAVADEARQDLPSASVRGGRVRDTRAALYPDGALGDVDRPVNAAAAQRLGELGQDRRVAHRVQTAVPDCAALSGTTTTTTTTRCPASCGDGRRTFVARQCEYSYRGLFHMGVLRRLPLAGNVDVRRAGADPVLSNGRTAAQVADEKTTRNEHRVVSARARCAKSRQGGQRRRHRSASVTRARAPRRRRPSVVCVSPCRVGGAPSCRFEGRGALNAVWIGIDGVLPGGSPPLQTGLLWNADQVADREGNAAPSSLLTRWQVAHLPAVARAPFLYVSTMLGVPPSMIVFVFAMLLAIVAGAGHRLVHGTTARHLYSIAWGTCLLLLAFGRSSLLFFALAALVYVLVPVLPRAHVNVVVFVVSLGYLSACHLYNMLVAFGRAALMPACWCHPS